jgi:hypothetical protein
MAGEAFKIHFFAISLREGGGKPIRLCPRVIVSTKKTVGINRAPIKLAKKITFLALKNLFFGGLDWGSVYPIV